MKRKVVVVGSGFAGLTAAFELGRKLSPSETITVISASPEFVFSPSLIYVVQGWRELADISFAIPPVLAEAGIEFIHARLEQIDPHHKTVTLDNGQVVPYSKLLLSTGGERAWDSLPGLRPKPQGNIISILSPSDALHARPYWQELLENPGPVVMGLIPGASLYGAVYELALNLAVALRKKHGQSAVDITFVTPEPFLGHFGHDGVGNSRQMLEAAFSQRGIRWLTNAGVVQVTPESVILASQRTLPSKFTLLTPPFRGIKPIRETPGLADEQGFVPVDPYYRSLKHLAIFAVGGAMRIKPKYKTPLPCEVFVPGVVSAEMGRIAAANITADLTAGRPLQKSKEDINAFYVLDSASQGLFLSLGPESWLNVQLNIPGPWSHWAKVFMEKHQIAQLQAGNF